MLKGFFIKYKGKLLLISFLLLGMLISGILGYVITDNIVFGDQKRIKRQLEQSMKAKDYEKALEYAKYLYDLYPVKVHLDKIEEIESILRQVDMFKRVKELVGNKQYIEAEALIKKINKDYVDVDEYDKLYQVCSDNITREGLLQRIDKALALEKAKKYEDSLKLLDPIRLSKFDDIRDRAENEYMRVRRKYDRVRYKNVVKLIDRGKLEDAEKEINRLLEEEEFTLVSDIEKELDRIEDLKVLRVEEGQYKQAVKYVKENRLDEALIILDSLINSNHKSIADKANTLLNEVKYKKEYNEN